MKVIHRIALNPDESQKSILKSIGLQAQASGGFTAFELEENSKEYQLLKPYIDHWGCMDAVGVVFTDEELNSANLLAFKDCWANGYPMPDDDRGYIHTTYDDSGYCNKCGIGLVQKEPFRLKKGPKWGSKKMFMLHWVYDEIFVRKDLYEEVFRLYGIDAKPVLLYKNDMTIHDTLQLVVPNAQVTLQLDDCGYDICSECKRKRYHLVTDRMLPSFNGDVSGKHMLKTMEYFGTGANARRYIYLSSEIRKRLIEYKAKVNFIPVNK